MRRLTPEEVTTIVQALRDRARNSKFNGGDLFTIDGGEADGLASEIETATTLELTQ